MPVDINEIYNHRKTLEDEIKKVDRLISDLTLSDKVKDFEPLLYRCFTENDRYQFFRIEKITEDGRILGTKISMYIDKKNLDESFGEIRTNEWILPDNIQEFSEKYIEITNEEFMQRMFDILKQLKLGI